MSGRILALVACEERRHRAVRCGMHDTNEFALVVRATERGAALPRSVRRRILAYSSRTGRSDVWLLDSGANLIIVPVGDPAILQFLDEPAPKISTANGQIAGRYAIVATPFGKVRGAVLPNSPRLLPMVLAVKAGCKVTWETPHSVVLQLHSGKEVSLSAASGIPLITPTSDWSGECKALSADLSPMTHTSPLTNGGNIDATEGERGAANPVRLGNADRSLKCSQHSEAPSGGLNAVSRPHGRQRADDDGRTAGKTGPVQAATVHSDDAVRRRLKRAKRKRRKRDAARGTRTKRVVKREGSKTAEGGSDMRHDDHDVNIDSSKTNARQGVRGGPNARPGEGGGLRAPATPSSNTPRRPRDGDGAQREAAVDDAYSPNPTRTLDFSDVMNARAAAPRDEVDKRLLWFSSEYVDRLFRDAIGALTSQGGWETSAGVASAATTSRSRSSPAKLRRSGGKPLISEAEATRREGAYAVIGRKDGEAWQKRYEQLFSQAYPAVAPKRLANAKARAKALAKSKPLVRQHRRHTPRVTRREAVEGCVAPDPHLLCHHPPLPGCPVCEQAKQVAGDIQYDLSKLKPDEGEVDEVFLVGDFAGPIRKSSRGNVVCYVMRWLRTDEERKFTKADGTTEMSANPLVVIPLKSRHAPDLLDGFHKARIHLRINKRPFEFRGDNEGATIGVEWTRYCTMHNGRMRHSLPGDDSTKSLQEGAVRLAVELLKPALMASGAPHVWWDECWRTAVDLYNFTMCQVDLRTNVILSRRQIPFGWAGTAVLPWQTYRPRKEDPRGVHCCFLGYVHQISIGVRIAFYDPQRQMLRMTMVAERRIAWGTTFAFERTVKNMKAIQRWLGGQLEQEPPGDVEIADRIEPVSDLEERKEIAALIPRELEDLPAYYWISCKEEGCGKRRPVTTALHETLTRYGCQHRITCHMLGLSCDTPEMYGEADAILSQPLTAEEEAERVQLRMPDTAILGAPVEAVTEMRDAGQSTTSIVAELVNAFGPAGIPHDLASDIERALGADPNSSLWRFWPRSAYKRGGKIVLHVPESIRTQPEERVRRPTAIRPFRTVRPAPGPAEPAEPLPPPEVVVVGPPNPGVPPSVAERESGVVRRLEKEASAPLSFDEWAEDWLRRVREAGRDPATDDESLFLDDADDPTSLPEPRPLVSEAPASERVVPPGRIVVEAEDLDAGVAWAMHVDQDQAVHLLDTPDHAIDAADDDRPVLTHDHEDLTVGEIISHAHKCGTCGKKFVHTHVISNAVMSRRLFGETMRCPECHTTHVESEILETVVDGTREPRLQSLPQVDVTWKTLSEARAATKDLDMYGLPVQGEPQHWDEAVATCSDKRVRLTSGGVAFARYRDWRKQQGSGAHFVKVPLFASTSENVPPGAGTFRPVHGLHPPARRDQKRRAPVHVMTGVEIEMFDRGKRMPYYIEASDYLTERGAELTRGAQYVHRGYQGEIELYIANHSKGVVKIEEGDLLGYARLPVPEPFTCDVREGIVARGSDTSLDPEHAKLNLETPYRKSVGWKTDVDVEGERKRERLGKRSANRTTKFTRIRACSSLLKRALVVGRSSVQAVLQEELLYDIAEGEADELVRRARAFVTKLCKGNEKNTPEAHKAREEEMAKMIGFEVFSQQPMTMAEARALYPNATVSGVYCITSIKFVEKARTEWKWKGRLVLLGNQIRRVSDLMQVFPTGDSIGIYGDVVSLEGFRAVLAHATAHGFDVEAADLTSAYLQARWPEGVPPHFVTMPPDTIEALPDDFRAKVYKAGGPRALMQTFRCLYGHPLSGHVWIETCLKYLRMRGWEEMPGNRALLRRGKCMIAIYVDDMCASGPREELDFFWQELCSPKSEEAPEKAFGPFLCGRVGPCTEFLGTQVRRSEDKAPDGFRYTYMDMSEYSAMIVKTWKELYPGPREGNKSGRLEKSWVPMRDPLKTEPEVLTTPKQDVQKMIGMLLWISRCARPEIAFALSRLGTRVSRWTPKCYEEMDRVVGYLLNTSGDKNEARESNTLVMKCHKQDTYDDLRSTLYTDADLSLPRSQSGFFYCLESERGSLLPIHWGSKKQSITADSTGSSELIAAHMGIRETLMVHDAMKPRGDPLLVLTDNSVVVRVARRGSSDALDYLAKRPIAIKLSLLRDMTDYGMINVEHVGTDLNRADIFTKQMDRVKFNKMREMLGLETKVVAAKSKTDKEAAAACHEYPRPHNGPVKCGGSGRRRAAGLRLAACAKYMVYPEPEAGARAEGEPMGDITNRQ